MRLYKFAKKPQEKTFVFLFYLKLIDNDKNIFLSIENVSFFGNFKCLLSRFTLFRNERTQIVVRVVILDTFLQKIYLSLKPLIPYIDYYQCSKNCREKLRKYKFNIFSVILLCVLNRDSNFLEHFYESPYQRPVFHTL